MSFAIRSILAWADCGLLPQPVIVKITVINRAQNENILFRDPHIVSILLLGKLFEKKPGIATHKPV
jgi:hypothetical protein